MFSAFFQRLSLFIFGMALVSGSFDFWTLALSLLLLAGFILPDLW